MHRTRLSLDGAWELVPDPARTLSAATLAAAPSRPTRVPGPWQAQHADLRDYAGVAWYRRTFAIAPEPGRHAALRFGAVDYHATVYLNGLLLGEHEGGYLPFELDATAALRPGANELVVRVLDPGDNEGPFPFDEIPHGKQSWYGPLGGIWQSVFLELRSPLHITAVQITPDADAEQAAVAVRLSAPAPRDARLELAVVDPHGDRTLHSVAVAGATRAVSVTVPIASPLRWDLDTPHLYRLETTLTVAGTPSDSVADSFGLRTIAASPEGLLLNGRLIYLRGALDQDYYPDLIATPFSDDELDAQFAQAKALGLNCLRTHIKVADPRYYAAADRAGLLIWAELPNWITLSDAAKQRATDTLYSMVERDWNHPSIVIWTIINEGWGVDLAHNAEHRAWLAATYAALKARDPQRLVVGNSACHGNFHVVTDIEDFHNYCAFPDHAEQWRDWARSFGSRPFWSFGHAYESSASWRAFVDAPWTAPARAALPDIHRRGDEPLIVSEFGIWGLPDLPSLYAAYGGEPWWFETGHDWGDGVVYPHGIERRFRTCGLERAFGDLGALTAASQRLQGLALKYQIEQLRLQQAISGYVITEFTDVHWEANGLLDICRRPKECAPLLARVNADDVVIPSCERTAGWSGEALTVNLALSHYSRRELRECRVAWRLDGFPQLAGVTPAVEPLRGGVIDLEPLRVMLPEVGESARARLILEWVTAGGDVVAVNEQELAILPRALQTAPAVRVFCPDPELGAQLAALGYTVCARRPEAEVVLVARLTDAEREQVQHGARVLCLAESEDALDTYLGNYLLGQLKVVERKNTQWQGDWASGLSWLRRDTLFGAIPCAGVVDQSFVGLTPECVITGLGAHEFADRVHAGLFVGWVHSPAALVAERRYGRGRLMLATFRLREHLEGHPIARVMLAALVAGLAGRTVEPRHGG
jgi:hypothetical protein